MSWQCTKFFLYNAYDITWKYVKGTVSKKEKKMEFSIKGPDPPSQHP